jgi:hypothetical protein
MAIITSFPAAMPALSTLLVGSQRNEENNTLTTKNFSVEDIISLVPPTAGFTGIIYGDTLYDISVVNGIITSVVVVS